MGRFILATAKDESQRKGSVGMWSVEVIGGSVRMVTGRVSGSKSQKGRLSGDGQMEASVWRVRGNH